MANHWACENTVLHGLYTSIVYYSLYTVARDTHYYDLKYFNHFEVFPYFITCVGSLLNMLMMFQQYFIKFFDVSLNYTDCHHLQLMDISIIIYSNSSIGFFLELVAMLLQFKSSKVINQLPIINSCFIDVYLQHRQYLYTDIMSMIAANPDDQFQCYRNN